MQNLVSNFGMFLSFLVVWIYVLNTRDKLVRPVKDYIYNYLAQMMLAFTLLWMYTFFAQYLTIWYGNLADEADRVDGNAERRLQRAVVVDGRSEVRHSIRTSLLPGDAGTYSAGDVCCCRDVSSWVRCSSDISGLPALTAPELFPVLGYGG